MGRFRGRRGRLTPVGRDELKMIRHALTSDTPPHTGIVFAGVDGAVVIQPTNETRHA